VSVYDKVAWSQGMFLQPHHFQQETRHLEHLVDARLRALTPHGWGFAELVIDDSLLALGRVGIARASGVLPDGTPFALPLLQPAPAPIDIPGDLKDEIIYLAAPLQRAGSTEFGHPSGTGQDQASADATRYEVIDEALRDLTDAADEPQLIQAGRLRLRLLRQRELSDAYTALGVIRVTERRSDDQLTVDRNYIPPQTRIEASGHLLSAATLLHGRIQQFARALVADMGNANQGVGELADFLLLLTLNQAEPVFRQIAGAPNVHPSDFHRACLQLAGGLSSFVADRRVPLEHPLYQHANLQGTFAPLIDDLRRALTDVRVRRASAIEITERGNGFRTASVRDTDLLASATLVLAVTAQLPAEQLLTRLLAQCKVGPVERIRELVSLALPGIALRNLPVAPRQLPFHAGHHYFEIERGGELWKQFERSGNLALHVSGDLPGLQLELWAIRP
jgi:type VI secretion system protein ImpJ